MKYRIRHVNGRWFVVNEVGSPALLHSWRKRSQAEEALNQLLTKGRMPTMALINLAKGLK